MTPEDEQSIYRFFTEVGIIRQLIDTKLEAYLPGRMSATQFGLLGHLARRPEGETPLQLANAFQLPKTSITSMLASLESHDLVTISPNPEDGRSKLVRATPQGGAFLQKTMAEMSAALAPTFGALGPEPFAAALPQLERVRIALDKERD